MHVEIPLLAGKDKQFQQFLSQPFVQKSLEMSNLSGRRMQLEVKPGRLIVSYLYDAKQASTAYDMNADTFALY